MKIESLLQELESFNLPKDSYVITGSGPLGIRKIRESKDLDIVINSDLWIRLLNQYGTIVKDGWDFPIIKLSENIEALSKESFPEPAAGAPTIDEQIRGAEIIEGYPFLSLEHLKFFKKLMSREKDLNDISLIEEWERKQIS